METLKITRIARNKKMSKDMKEYTSVGIQTDKYEGKWINGFQDKENASWVVGSVVQLSVVPKGDYLNFSFPKSAKKVEGLRELDDKIKEIEFTMGFRLDLIEKALREKGIFKA